MYTGHISTPVNSRHNRSDKVCNHRQEIGPSSTRLTHCTDIKSLVCVCLSVRDTVRPHMRGRLTCGTGGRDVGREGQRLQSSMRCKCNLKEGKLTQFHYEARKREDLANQKLMNRQRMMTRSCLKWNSGSRLGKERCSPEIVPLATNFEPKTIDGVTCR